MASIIFLNVLSTGLLLVAAVFYRKAYTPPTARADESIRVKQTTKRILPMIVSRRLSFVIKYIVFVHLMSEAYALWVVTEAPPFNFKASSIESICPLADSSNTRNVYPARQLPVSALIGLLFIVSGGLVRGSCHRRLGKFFTWETSIHRDHKLITSGPYRYVRHPGYSGLISVGIGYTIFLWTSGTFGRECFIGSDFPPKINRKSTMGILFASLLMCIHLEADSFLVRRSFEEDKLMKTEFGKEWVEWATNVRWNVIPFII